MQEFQLGISERLYYGGGEVQELSWEQYQERKANPTTVSVSTLAEDTTKPATVHWLSTAPRNPRRAGRMKLTPEQIEQRDAKAEQRRQQRLATRTVKERERAERLQREADAKKARMLKAKLAAERKEQQQIRVNKWLNEPKVVASTAAHPVEQAQLAVGVPPLPGHSAVRVDHKTWFYVKHGRDHNQALADYKHKHGLI